MIGTRYSTAEDHGGSLAQRANFQRFEGACGPAATLIETMFAAALLVAFGNGLGLMISNTDSAAPAVIYRVVSNHFYRGNLVAACLPTAVEQEGLVRGYLRAGPCLGDAEPVGKIVGALPGDIVEIESGWVAVNGVRFPRSAVAASDSVGRPIPHALFGKYEVAANKVWLFGFISIFAAHGQKHHRPSSPA